MITLFYTTEEGGEFRPIRTSATLSQVKKGFWEGVLRLPERTVKFFSVMLPNGDIYDVLKGYRDLSNYHPYFATFSKKRIFRELYKALFFSGRESTIGGKMGAAQQILKPCKCGRMPVISVRSESGPELIQVCCDLNCCTTSVFNPEVYSLKQAARKWNKEGRFLYRIWNNKLPLGGFEVYSEGTDLYPIAK